MIIEIEQRKTKLQHLALIYAVAAKIEEYKHGHRDWINEFVDFATTCEDSDFNKLLESYLKSSKQDHAYYIVKAVAAWMHALEHGFNQRIV